MRDARRVAIGIQLYEDPRKLALLQRIAVATESIAETLKATTAPIDPDAISSLSERLKNSTDALADVVAANPLPEGVNHG